MLALTLSPPPSFESLTVINGEVERTWQSDFHRRYSGIQIKLKDVQTEYDCDASVSACSAILNVRSGDQVTMWVRGTHAVWQIKSGGKLLLSYKQAVDNFQGFQPIAGFVLLLMCILLAFALVKFCLLPLRYHR
jgi:hypothetical protein